MYWQHFAKQSSDLLCVVDSEGTYVWANHRWAQVFGRSDEEMLGHAFVEFMHPDDLADAVVIFERVMSGSHEASPHTVIEFTGRYRHVDGHYLWLEWNASPPTDGVIYATARDVTARMERELEQAPWIRLLGAIEDHTGMGRWGTDLRTGETYWSPAVASIYGYEPDATSLDYDRGLDAFHPDDADWVLRLVKESVVAGAPFEYEARIVRPDGGLRWIEVQGLVEKDASGIATMLHGLVKDTTEERLHDERLMYIERLATIGKLAAGVAHEINNPLQFLSMNLEMLSEDFRGRATPAELDSIEDALEGVDRVRKIVEVLRRFGRTPSTRRQRVAPEDLLDDAVRVMGRGACSAAMERVVAPDLPELHVERESIVQALVNLCTNACHSVEALDADGGILVRVFREVDEAGDVVVFEVEDEGLGLPPEHLDRVFEPFYTTKAGGLGTGLGLSTTRGIAATHGGDITLSNRTDRVGALARLTLPVFAEEEPVADTHDVQEVPMEGADATRNSEAEEHAPRILVVDDEQAIASLLSRYLERIGYEVEVAGGGEEALEVLEGRRDWGLILCDLKMPDLDGKDLRRLLLERAPELERRLHFMTGDSWSEENHDFLTSLKRRHLNKPFVVTELVTFVEETYEL